jgi:hypothetical protein
MTFRLESLEKSGGTRKPAVAELRHALHFGRRWWRMGWGATIAGMAAMRAARGSPGSPLISVASTISVVSTGPPPPAPLVRCRRGAGGSPLKSATAWEMGTTAGCNALRRKTSCGFRRVVSALSVGRRPGWGDCAPIAEKAAAARWKA